MERTNTVRALPFPEQEVFGIPASDHHRLQPLLFLPEQFFGTAQQSAAVWNGERRLLFAVLQDAVACWFRYRHSRSDSGRELFQEIREWFWEKDRERLYSFESICVHLDLDAEYFRRKLMRWDTTLGINENEEDLWLSPCNKMTRRRS
ncbi:MAG: hypothetical protein AB7G75_36250 [Candidatus Binatia bacterium]